MSRLVLLLLLVPTISIGEVIHVPGDAPAIFWAVGIAESGDEIVVACGTYYEWDINVVAKDLIIRSEGGNAGCVVVDCLDQGRFIRIQESHVELEGITVMNGNRPSDGGAILVTNDAVVGQRGGPRP